jgi:hypothetical protein
MTLKPFSKNTRHKRGFNWQKQLMHPSRIPNVQQDYPSELQYDGRSLLNVPL